jgi:hypothetical protein
MSSHSAERAHCSLLAYLEIPCTSTPLILVSANKNQCLTFEFSAAVAALYGMQAGTASMQQRKQYAPLQRRHSEHFYGMPAQDAMQEQHMQTMYPVEAIAVMASQPLKTEIHSANRPGIHEVFVPQAVHAA